MDPLDMMWRGVAVPVLTSTAILLAGLRPRRIHAQSGRRGRSSAPAAAAVTAGYAAGHLALINWSWPGFPPADTTHWPLFLAPAALAAALLAERRSPPPLVRWILPAGLVAVAVTAAAFPLLRSGADRSAGISAALLAAGTLVWWGAMDQSARRLPPAPFLVALLTVLTGASVALVISGTGLVAQLVGALAAAVGPLLLLALWKRDLLRGAFLLPVVAVVLGTLWTNGVLYTYAELHGISALLLAAAAAPLAGVWAPPLRRMAESPRPLDRWIAAGIPAGSALVPLGAAVALAVSRSAEMIY